MRESEARESEPEGVGLEGVSRNYIVSSYRLYARFSLTVGGSG